MTDLDSIARLAPAKQQALLRRRILQPFIRGVLRAGVRGWVLANALEAELRDLEQMEDEGRNG